MRVVRRLLAVTFLWVLALPVGLIILGAASNQIAMIANGGSMPVERTPRGSLDSSTSGGWKKLKLR